MKTSPIKTFTKLSLGLLICALAACFSQKNTLFNRNLQNLTAHYNILYNANLLLDESEQNIRLAYQDNYDHLIPVYQEPNETLSRPEDAKLDEALLKANKIINEKTQSHYLGDAYFVIAKANHLKSNFFNALGFFDYVHETYKKQNDLGQASLAWKARSLIQLELFDEAQATLDTTLKYIDLKKKSAADIYATRAQMHIYKNQNEEAITFLSKAQKKKKNRRLDRIRWTYLLAQLQQLTGKKTLAYTNYTKIVRSNADFTMTFNANLNRISIEAEENGAKVDRVARLKKLLKDDNNTELIDQIYYHIGIVYEEDKDVENAIKNYKIAIQKSTKNQHQKGLSYLKLADIYFNSADYIKSKAYYDSTLSTLSKDNTDYKKIQKKASHIELLADRLSTIAKENLLQTLAQLPEDKRNSQIDSIVTAQIASTSSTTDHTPSNANQQTSGNTGDQKFYFSNATALSQGLATFKKTWGDHVLEDDWRRSQKTNLNIHDISNSANQPNATGVSSTTADSTSLKQFDKDKRTLIASIPFTSEQCVISDQKIASAYFDIATHYREIINDPEEAIRTYEKLLIIYPDNHHKLPTYYNLYRLYETRNPDKSAYYKNLILAEYPESIFAKTILNPRYSQKASELEWALNLLYNETYCTYTEKKYDEVIRYTSLAQAKFGLNKLSPQLAYLNALAAGHTHKLDVFEASLKQITNDFAGDSLVVPLIQKQLIFINAHRKSLASREFALLDNDLDSDSPEPSYFEEPQMETISPTIHVEDKPVPTTPITPTHVAETPKAPPTPDHSHFFSTEESTEYYFIVDITESTFNLSSSRFGIGQFNRSQYPDKQIKHQLKLLENQNQWIFVGVFPNKEAVAVYYSKINPLMSQIMKIPANKYVTFYISKQNFEKCTNREVIDWYIDFFKKTVNK